MSETPLIPILVLFIFSSIGFYYMGASSKAIREATKPRSTKITSEEFENSEEELDKILNLFAISRSSEDGI